MARQFSDCQLNVSQFTRQSGTHLAQVTLSGTDVNTFMVASMGGSSTWDKVEVEQEDSRPAEVNLLPSNLTGT